MAKRCPDSEGVGPHPVDSGGRVDEQSVAVTTLLALVHDVKCLVNGENFDIEDPLLGAEVEAASGLAFG